jgi:lysozyme family protein
MTFDEAFDRLIGHEAGFTKEPQDEGNWTGGRQGVGELKGTKYGIAANTYPGEDIPHLTLERAKFLYRRDVWGRAGCEVFHECLKFDLFDTAVHSGYKQTLKFMQRASGLPPHDVDGVLGPQTLMVVQSMNPYRALARFNGQRLDFLNNLAVWEKYHEGWSQRIAENLMAA